MIINGIGMLAKIRHYVIMKTLVMAYHGIFSSLLLYGYQIWGQSNQSILKMEKLQNKALRIINFKPSRYSVNHLYNKSEILKFGDSIKLSNFLFAHDNLKNNLPSTLCGNISLVDANFQDFLSKFICENQSRKSLYNIFYRRF